MNDVEVALRFGAALGLGVFLGLERERSKGPEGSFAGVRTFGLMSLTGAVAGFVEQELGLPWLSLVAFLSVASLIVVSYVVTARRGDVGGTSEVSAVLALLLGLLCQRGYVAMAAALAVCNAMVLVLKDALHRLARRVETADVEATLKFAIITLIVLPLVPDRNLGVAPLEVINPHKIWMMVVLISGLNFASYILVKVLGQEHGIGIAGILGGLVSSTAVTLGFSQRSRQQADVGQALGFGILLAWTIMFIRVTVMVAVVNRELLRPMAWPVGAMAATSAVASFVLWRRHRSSARHAVSGGENPFELTQAIQFGLLYGGVTFLAKVCQLYFGDAGLYVAGFVTGLTDVDAITLSMANLARETPGAADVAARTVIIAILANTAVKAGIATLLGSPSLRQALLPISGLLLLAGTLALLI